MNNYLVCCSKRGCVFATLEEASKCANEIFQKTGFVVAVVKTKRKVTHLWVD